MITDIEGQTHDNTRKHCALVRATATEDQAILYMRGRLHAFAAEYADIVGHEAAAAYFQQLADDESAAAGPLTFRLRALADMMRDTRP